MEETAYIGNAQGYAAFRCMIQRASLEPVHFCPPFVICLLDKDTPLMVSYQCWVTRLSYVPRRLPLLGNSREAPAQTSDRIFHSPSASRGEKAPL